MALIKCSECEREISDKARSCPHCGYVIPPPKIKLSKIDWIFIPLISITIFIGMLGCISFPSFIKHSYPNAKTYTTYDNNGLIGYDSEGNEIRGNTSTNHYSLGKMETDYTKANLVVALSITIPISLIVVYVIAKKKEKNKVIIIKNQM